MNEKPFLHLNELYIRDEKEMTRWVKTWSKSSRKAYDGESVLHSWLVLRFTHLSFFLMPTHTTFVYVQSLIVV